MRIDQIQENVKEKSKDFVLRKLLRNNNFIFLNYENMSYFNINNSHDIITTKQLDYDRFHSILLIKKIAMIFYNNEKASLKYQFHILFLFHKIISNVVTLIATKIRHYFIEY